VNSRAAKGTLAIPVDALGGGFERGSKSIVEFDRVLGRFLERPRIVGSRSSSPGRGSRKLTISPGVVEDDVADDRDALVLVRRAGNDANQVDCIAPPLYLLEIEHTAAKKLTDCFEDPKLTVSRTTSLERSA
jgi:hypothetical protein